MGKLAMTPALCLAGWAALAAATGARAEYPRRTPVVEAVRKTRPSVVTIKVDKDDGDGGTRPANGTGVIVDERGYLVTNSHLVHGALRVVVRLAGGAELLGRILTEDPRCDLAVLKVRSARRLPALRLAPASDVMVGETVIAVGNPYGYRNTVSTGIVSATGREVEMPSGGLLTGLLQTDASINPGNSGGPLLNINGELIGINTAIRDGARGIAFAINADTVQRVLARHLSASRVSGVRHGLDCKEAVAERGKDRQHLVVAGVEEGTPAAAAGLRRGDRILRVAGRDVANRFDLERALWGARPGQRVRLQVARGGKVLTVPLRLAGQEDPETTAGRYDVRHAVEGSE